MLLFTEGSELINTHSGNGYGLDVEALELRTVFGDLFFITPHIARNWSVNEAKQYQLGLIFPANLNGLLELSKCLTFFDAEEDRKRFKDWRAQFLLKSDEFNEVFDDFGLCSL